jgi:hypothetical protein
LTEMAEERKKNVVAGFGSSWGLNTGAFRHKQGLVRKHMLAKRDNKLHLVNISERHFVGFENGLSPDPYGWLNTHSYLGISGSNRLWWKERNYHAQSVRVSYGYLLVGC